MRRLILLPAALLSLGLLGAACGADASAPAADGATSVRDITPILTQEPVFTTGANGVVTMQLETTIEVGCNIVFGPGDSYGVLATDVDMADGAHDSHTVILGELTPGDVIHYNLQGASPDGQLYQGAQDRTFVVPEPGGSTLATGAPDAAADGRSNLALGTTATASSEFNANFRASNAIDGNPATEWSSRGDGDDAWIEVDLGAPTAIGGIGFWTRDMSDGTAIIHTVRVFVDGQDLGVHEVGRDLTAIDVQATGQIVRVEAEATTGGNTGAVELAVYPV